MTSFKTLDHFCCSLLDARWETYTIIDDATHTKHQLLKGDLASLDPNEIHDFAAVHGVDFYLGKGEDIETGRRTEYFVHLMQRAVAAERLKLLSSVEDRPLPYSSGNLKEVELDEHYLMPTNLFTGNPFGWIYNEYGYELCPATGASNSSYWTGNAIVKIAKEKKVVFRARLNPFIEKPLGDYRPMQFRMTVYGVPLDWKKLKQLQTDDFGQWMNEKEYGDHSFTDYVWHPDKDEIHFTCEELPKENEIAYRGSRYFHAIFDKATGLITHCDGAIRIYTEDELAYRKQFHVRQAPVRKMGKRVKIFQIDKTKLDHEDFALLAKSFFVWNDDVQRYFY